ncbi:MAG: hypothetical protein ACNS64_11190 [Candidatus Halalkalibacterium sp. M3_1C_030]
MKKNKQNHIYVYDENYHQIIVIDGETGEKIDQKDDRVTSILKYLQDKGHTAKLRKFAVWCAHQTNDEIKPIQKKLIELAESAIEGEATTKQLRELYDETEGAAIATDTVGLRQGSDKAPAFLTTRECINPNPYDAALQAARFHRLWAELKHKGSGKEKFLKEIKVNTAADIVRETEQKQIDYLLDLINKD